MGFRNWLLGTAPSHAQMWAQAGTGEPSIRAAAQPFAARPFSAPVTQWPPAPGVESESTTPMPDSRLTITNENWQAEVWDFYDNLGEFTYAVDWRAEMISRVRLRAAKIIQNADEPEVVDTGAAADLIDRLEEGTVGGRAQLMRGFATQLGVPGECWLTGVNDNGIETWRVRSSDEIRESKTSRNGNRAERVWEVLDDTRVSSSDKWIELGGDVMVTRVWEPHPRFFHKANSPARAARPVMRELELVNRHIQAQYLSRLATAGVFQMPSEASFPVRPEFASMPDPLAAEWIATAREAIQNPGTAAAVIPLLLRAPYELREGFKFHDFTVKLDEKILEKRDSAIRRLATQLDLPAEVLLGMGDVNHWSAWQLEESGIKVHILPMVERICNALTIGYLRPRLKVAGEDPAEWVVWYDASEITIRPDRSQQATEAYDRLEINGDAYRREVGFDESDKPSDDELADMILKALAKDPTNALTALEELTGVSLEPPDAVVDDAAEAPAATGEGDQTEPDTRDEAPPVPDEDLAARLERAVQLGRERQRDMRHWLVRDLRGASITHPAACSDLPTRCPYSTVRPTRLIPGRSGTYEVTIENGQLVVGRLRQDVAGAHQGT